MLSRGTVPFRRGLLTALCEWRRPAQRLCSVNGYSDGTFSIDNVKAIERFWKPRLKDCVRQAQTRCPQDPKKPLYYVLSMFPYPSGQLHMGHVRVYAISDAMAHFYRMNKRKVLHPMGWDAFGLPAENAALERSVAPQLWTQKNIESMRAQLDDLGYLFDWDHEITTCNPDYYKWTQFIFTKLFEHGLAYQHEAMVNWDPVDKTVLADEQVDDRGRSWRSGALIQKRLLRQWFIRSTKYSEVLYRGLNDPSLKDWRDIVPIQQNWIGQCDGTRLLFRLQGSSGIDGRQIWLWTDSPELLFGACAVVVSAKHVLHASISEAGTASFFAHTLNCHLSRLPNVAAISPFSAQPLPVFIVSEEAGKAVTGFQPGAESIIVIPDSCSLHQQLASELRLPFRGVLHPSEPSEQPVLAQSDFLDGLPRDQARLEIMSRARDLGVGGEVTSAKLGDWLISRQRYWGTPIPIIHCTKCGPVAVPEADLPVRLPPLVARAPVSESGDAHSPLAQMDEWVNTSCPKCHGSARRETDTMDTFVDSSWYFLRYLDPQNQGQLCAADKAASLPVDLYIGGKEHATLHLYYARVMTRFLHEIGLCPVKEPFASLLVQGMVKGQSYRLKDSGKYLPKSAVRVDADSGMVVEASSGSQCVVEWEKMSKSKYNGVEPGDVLATYGCDLTRLLILSDISPMSDRKWCPEESFVRIHNMLSKLFGLVEAALGHGDGRKPGTSLSEEEEHRHNLKLWDARNFYIRGVNHCYNSSRNLSMVMSRVQGLMGELSAAPLSIKHHSMEYQRGLGSAIIVMTPLCPHICAELWSRMAKVPKRLCQDFAWGESVFQQPWPQLDPDYCLKLHVMHNNKQVVELPVPVHKFRDLSEQDALAIALDQPAVKQLGLVPGNYTVKLFQKQDLYDAQLNLSRVQEYSSEELAALRQAKQLQKLQKQQRRQQRIDQYGRSKKTSTSKTV